MSNNPNDIDADVHAELWADAYSLAKRFCIAVANWQPCDIDHLELQVITACQRAGMSVESLDFLDDLLTVIRKNTAGVDRRIALAAWRLIETILETEATK
jgi:hypothetical protein